MRIRVKTDCKPGFKVYRTWTQVIKAIQRGERDIRTSRTVNPTGCYNNQFSRLIKDLMPTTVCYIKLNKSYVIGW